MSYRLYVTFFSVLFLEDKGAHVCVVFSVVGWTDDRLMVLTTR